MKKRFYIFFIEGASLPDFYAKLLCIKEQPKEGFKEESDAEEALSKLFLLDKKFATHNGKHYVILPTYVYE